MTKLRDYHRLDGEQTSLIFFSENDSIPEILYWGVRLPDQVDYRLLSQLSEQAITFATLDERIPDSIMPEASRGFMGHPGMLAHRNGSFFSHRFVMKQAKKISDGLRFYFEDHTAQLELVSFIQIDSKTDVVKANNTLINRADDDLNLDWLSCPTLTAPPNLTMVTTLYGRWGNEFQQETQRIPHGGAISIENRRGRTSHEHFPGVLLSEAISHESYGQVLGAHLAWSSNYKITIEKLDNGRHYIQAGVLFAPGEITLESGESYQTPDLYGTIGIGRTQVSHRFHDYVRSHILPRFEGVRPVLCNSWEAVYFDHNMDQLKAMIDSAHDVGVERLVLDDGWFLGRRSPKAGLGDWQVDPSVYPEGLHTLINYAQDKGMEFGLWFEPEMVNQDSKLYRDHPDWVLHNTLYPMDTERHQLVLNLGHEPAFQYIYGLLSQILRDYPIAYIKWDMNRTLVTPTGKDGKPAAYAQARAVYRLMGQLRKDHPKLQIESCSSGGGRADFEVLRYCNRVWTSDNNDPLSRLAIHEGFSLFFPPEIMGCHIGDQQAHLSSCYSDIHYRSMVALQGQLGFETNLAKASDEDKSILKKYVNIYKNSRQWIERAKVYRSQCSGRQASVLAYVSEDCCRSLWWVITRHDNDPKTSSHFKPMGLKPDLSYRVHLESMNSTLLESNLKEPMAILHDDIEIDGHTLMQMGLLLPTLKPQSGLLLSINSL